jgi:BirA family transcriptional regulator, biotin operon repressor / biotin---[acetyl-CoA-carboxylase] ligase
LRNGETSGEGCEFPPVGWRVERLARVGSTNDEARRRALDGDPGRLWIIADEQTGGRGRRGRVWTSPPGNLYASGLLIDPSPVAVASQIGFVAGVALRNAVEDLGGAEIGLKWPNDLIWRGGKLAGLLVEGAPLGDGRMACIVGIGVNCASAPTGLVYATDHLSNVLGRPVAPEDVFARLAPRFEEALAEWRRGDGFALIRARWLAGAAGLGGPIRIDGANGLREGIFSTVDDHGRLVLSGAQGAEIIEAGDFYVIKENAGG